MTKTRTSKTNYDLPRKGWSLKQGHRQREMALYQVGKPMGRKHLKDN